jgi:hypothetical protein
MALENQSSLDTLKQNLIDYVRSAIRRSDC